MKVCYIVIHEAEGKDFDEAANILEAAIECGDFSGLYTEEIWAEDDIETISNLIEYRRGE